jgi:hypothetical protein
MKIATALAARLADLASAAERSGAAAPAVARLLEAASVAAVQAVALEARVLTGVEPPVAAERLRPVFAGLREAA